MAGELGDALSASLRFTQVRFEDFMKKSSCSYKHTS
jgi:hypothetical protein